MAGEEQQRVTKRDIDLFSIDIPTDPGDAKKAQLGELGGAAANAGRIADQAGEGSEVGKMFGRIEDRLSEAQDQVNRG